MKQRCDICGRVRSVRFLVVRKTYMGVRLARAIYVCAKHCQTQCPP